MWRKENNETTAPVRPKIGSEKCKTYPRSDSNCSTSLIHATTVVEHARVEGGGCQSVCVCVCVCVLVLQIVKIEMKYKGFSDESSIVWNQWGI